MESIYCNRGNCPTGQSKINSCFDTYKNMFLNKCVTEYRVWALLPEHEDSFHSDSLFKCCPLSKFCSELHIIPLRDQSGRQLIRDQVSIIAMNFKIKPFETISQLYSDTGYTAGTLEGTVGGQIFKVKWSQLKLTFLQNSFFYFLICTIDTKNNYLMYPH